MKLAIAVAAVILTGCKTTADLQATVGGASNFQLCRAIMLAPADVGSIARAEAQRRALDCAPYAGLVMQNQAAENAASNAAMQQLLAPKPQAPLRPPVHCRSVQQGTVVQTVCN